MPTRSIELTDDAASELREYLALTGESEAAVLARALSRGLKGLRIEQAIRVFKERGSSSEAAAIAGLPRADFLQLLIDEGVNLLDGPSTVGKEVEMLGERLGNARLRAAARELTSESR